MTMEDGKYSKQEKHFWKVLYILKESNRKNEINVCSNCICTIILSSVVDSYF